MPARGVFSGIHPGPGFSSPGAFRHCCAPGGFRAVRRARMPSPGREPQVRGVYAPNCLEGEFPATHIQHPAYSRSYGARIGYEHPPYTTGPILDVAVLDKYPAFALYPTGAMPYAAAPCNRTPTNLRLIAA